jgi:hypothetical protein
MFSRKAGKSSRDLFFVSSCDWETVLEAGDASEAATRALEDQIERNPVDTNVSTVVLALNLNKTLEEADAPSNLEVLYAPQILANAGMHEESKRLQYIIDEIKSIS